jgi:gluconate 2-dehydrogenase alpha chain
MPPLRRSGWTELMAGAARRLGLHPYPGPAAINSQPFDGRAACTYCGFCNWNGCHADAKASTYLNAIPKAEATGNLDVVTGARVTGIEVGRDGLANRVRYVREGREEVQPARFVFLSAHALENVRLLLLSRSPAHREGLGNDRGQVGRNAMSHLYVGVDGVFPGRKLNRFGGTWPQCTSVDDFNAANFDSSGLGFVGGGCISAIAEAKPIATALSTPASVPRWGAVWKDWLAKHGNSVGRLVAAAESLAYEDSFLDLDPRVTDAHGLPVLRTTYRLHEQEQRRYDFLAGRMRELLLEAGASETWPSFPKLPAAPFQSLFGATRMGDDPASSVVDRDCVLHDAPNVAVVGSSSFPTSGGYGPTATIQALAWRTAERVVASIGR